MTAHDADRGGADTGNDPLAVICGGGALPYAVANAVVARGRRVVLFPFRGWADPEQVVRFPHHWIALGQFGRFMRLARSEGCRDIVWIGSLVRPAIGQLRFDVATLRQLPRVLRAYRGGDDHLLSSLGRIFEEQGFRLLGAHEVAPELLAATGAMTRAQPNDNQRADIVRGLAILAAIGPFDIGQAVIVAGQHCLAVEGAEGTDGLLARVAEMRRTGRIRTAAGGGVLVKAAKPGQDHRFDLPTIGPQTVEGVVHAGLAGIAVVAGSAIMAETERLVALADRNGTFVVGVRNDGTLD
jgi:UDP-2,3-diacylglucosamine hydrolase